MLGEEKKTITIEKGDLFKKSLELMKNDNSLSKLATGAPELIMLINAFVVKLEISLFKESEDNN